MEASWGKKTHRVVHSPTPPHAQADQDKLHRAVKEAEECLATAWQRPSTALRVTRRKKAELDGLLAEIVTRESASEALFQACFPDVVLVEEYKKKMEADVAAAETEGKGGATDKSRPAGSEATGSPVLDA